MLNKKKFYTAFAAQLLINCILLFILFTIYVYETRQSNFLFWSVTYISLLMVTNIIFYTVYIDMLRKSNYTKDFQILHDPKGMFGGSYPYNVGRYFEGTNSWFSYAYCATEEQAKKVKQELETKNENDKK